MTTSFTGGCLCGLVRYQINGNPIRFYHCHCSRCRKVSGTGNASNLMVELENYQWTKGEHLIKFFKVPEAERFTNYFCSECGSPLPKIRPNVDIAVIPAGSLDDEPDFKPQAHIFWNSRTEWSCGSGDLPVFEEYPSDS
ncbi:MAG: GFA family protein [Thalassolituus sp.]|nr:GFA family protein [Thalassolituus oleivorans]PCI50664.1 MAG: aldehyde-activating protein [Oceanospirillales bacterium]PHQ87923.1 MAG: aldehyde-activating protein [Thalassobium sp.]MBQ0727365.1 GFA family protein [Thalassolituus oleivorans]MBQ0781865.1 GFA family protein [Thalassolituus oleivorans]MDF1640084.1 GFA family protein [Thalassolituus oleivorans]